MKRNVSGCCSLGASDGQRTSQGGDRAPNVFFGQRFRFFYCLLMFFVGFWGHMRLREQLERRNRQLKQSLRRWRWKRIRESC